MDINEYISSGIIEMYVMGLCSEEEEKELETLRDQYPVVGDAICKYEMDIEEKMLQMIKLPSPVTDKKILDSLNALQSPVKNMEIKKAESKTYSWLGLVAAAAVLLLVISAYYNYTLYYKSKAQEQALLESKKKGSIETLPLVDYNILRNPQITPVAMYGVGTHAICRCTMFWDKKTGKMYIMIHHLPQSSSSRDYQLWAMVNGQAISIGIIKDEIRGRFIEMQNIPAAATAFTITLEKAGGTTTPTVEETYLSGHI